ncbi:MAG: hydroxymethylpyrimidine/phosphomethylpyrimidine kinase [Fibromonadaceae bacterium]|jgi:hydroxymethylpyrimidine/phosphomethylpyrimidine kinase|nr:hydroxymethylpyrimidine/phosphomethylpyrimidine kinase [Fibromonadaceae bacterium]
MLTKPLLTIAGFDPSAGAGILADIKAFEHCGVYGQAVCTALTVQNEEHFKEPGWVSWQQIKAQLLVLSRVRDFNYIKIGLVESPQTLEKILKWLRKKYPESFILWDPILKASAGFEFHKQNAVSWQKLFTYVNLITPNLPEAEFLGISKGSLKAAVLVKGGHSLNSQKSEDLLFLPHSPTPVKFVSKRIKKERHGSGCTLSALILANFARHKDLEKAIHETKKVMQGFFMNGTGKLGVIKQK